MQNKINKTMKWLEVIFFILRFMNFYTVIGQIYFVIVGIVNLFTHKSKMCYQASTLRIL